jgi:hypothetical protein
MKMAEGQSQLSYVEFGSRLRESTRGFQVLKKLATLWSI